MFRKLFFMMVVIAGVVASSAPAWAGLHFSNNTTEKVLVAVAYEATTDVWVIRGWFPIEPGANVEVLTGNLKQRFYYFHANSASGKMLWDGSFSFAVDPPNPFTFFRVGGTYGTLPPTATMRGFRAIDTGAAQDFTLPLTPPPSITPPPSPTPPASIPPPASKGVIQGVIQE